MTPDPIGLGGGINLYAYVGGNPVNWIDPWGLDYDGAVYDAFRALNTGAKGPSPERMAELRARYEEGRKRQDQYNEQLQEESACVIECMGPSLRDAATADLIQRMTFKAIASLAGPEVAVPLAWTEVALLTKDVQDLSEKLKKCIEDCLCEEQQ